MTFILIIIGLLIIVLVITNLTRKNRAVVSLSPVKNKETFQPTHLIIDTETTGLIKDNSLRVTKSNVTDFADNFPRIVQLCYMLIDKNGQYDGAVFFIKQTEPIPPESIKIHGITDEKCKNSGVELREALDSLALAATKVDNLVGHNISFDYKVLHAEYLKNGIAFPLQKKNKIDTMKLVGKHLGKSHGFKISLYNAADELFGTKAEWIELKKRFTKHDAESDVFTTALIFNLLSKKYVG